MIKTLNKKFRNFEKKQKIDQHKIEELQEKLENATDELNKNMNNNHNKKQEKNKEEQENVTYLNQKLTEYEHEIKKWRNKYSKLKQSNIEVFEIFTVCFICFLLAICVFRDEILIVFYCLFN